MNYFLMDVGGDLLEEVRAMYEGSDPAHDFSHILRVYKNALYIGEREGADIKVLLLAALLHDVGPGSKRSEESEDSKADRLKLIDDFLKNKGYPSDIREKILYAVDVHRFSKGTTPSTMEARILQDADRLDAMGAIGIARVFLTGGVLGRALYSPEDPFCASREPDDRLWNLDHFFRKLLKLEGGMHTGTAKKMAESRGDVLRRYLADLKKEIEG